MPPTARLAFCAVAFAAAAASPYPAAASQVGRAMETVHPNGPEATRGIGVIRLGEKRASVEAALGPGKLVSSGTEEGFSHAEQFKEASYRYRSGAITLEVVYGEGASEPGVANETDSISTSSPSALLFDRRLSAGLKTFERILKARHWRIFHCDGEAFTTLLPGGPGTGISWEHGRLHKVVIDAGGSWGQQCER
jgi:hypothetical protein